MMEVSTLECANARDQASQRPGERVGDEEDECAADQDRGQSQQD